MSVFTVATFLGVLALIAYLGVLVAVGARLMERLGLVPEVIGALRVALRPAALWLAALVALIAMIGSLYFSEVAGFTPCTLCWYQRIAMYPLVVILAVAAVRSDVGVARYAGPLATIGALVAVWHIGVERIPGLPSGSCSLDAPCSTILVQVVGFITIPTMALAAFLAILSLLLLASSGGTEPERESLG